MNIENKDNQLNERQLKSKSDNQPVQAKEKDFFVFPLSYQQESLWFIDQLEPGRAIYNIPLCLKVEGKLNIPTLEKSLKIMINRHEVLRTCFDIVNGEISQIIYANQDFKIRVVELSNFPFDERLEKALSLANDEVRSSFDLKKSPLFRCHIIKLDELNHLLTFTFHHIVFDGWSVGIFIKELGNLYNNLNAGENTLPDEPPLQFADFTIWQREWFQSETKQKQLKFWKEELKDSNTSLELPADFIRPAKQSHNGNFELIKLPADLVEDLKSLSLTQGATLFMTLLSALKILIYRYSGQTDISVGSPIAIRNSEELENLLGFYVNTIVFRSALEDNLSFKDLLAQVRQRSLNIFENLDLPFDKVVEEIQPKRELNRNPLFQIMFALQTVPEYESDFDNLKFDPVQLGTGTSKFDLLIELKESKRGIEGFIEYSTDLFKADSLKRLADHFEILLREIISNPDKNISDYSLLSPEENKFLDSINNTEILYSGPQSLHRLFEEQVEKTPDKIAVEFEGKVLTYSELNAKSNQVADYLRKLGIQAGSLVGICIDRSLEMFIGMIGILKTGCAYVPMDPAFPPDRLNYMLEDANIMFLLTSNKLKKIFNRQDLKFVLLDDDWEFIEKENDKNVHSQISSEELSYVIYTSGSTGKPKGVQITHKAVVNFLHSMQEKPGLTPDDIIVSVTTISFDISVLELFLPIVTGAKLIIASKAASSDGNLLLRLLDEKNASVMQATPATWRLMIESGWESSPNLKMLCGGEALPLELANQMLERGCSLWNMYGPTETTIWSAVKKIEPGSDAVLIGPPIANTQFYILDKKMNPVPINVPGELLIGGDGLAKGYLNRSELTNEKFIPNPFSQSGSKLYRTGDLARFKPNGDVEFLGRLDFQVKIRGFRIELGEIEKVLEMMDTIQSALVIGKEFGAGDMRLIAYFIPSSESTVEVKQIKNYLAQKLPDYMIPSFFVSMVKFPLTPNGKIDRKNLPAPDDLAIATLNEHVPPSDDTESKLIEIWKKVLGLNKIGVTDNFFEIGGHSLLAARLFAHIEREMGEALPLAVLFQAPTIKEISNIIKKKDTKAIWSTLVPIRKAGSKPPLFLVHGAEGNVLLYRDLANYLGADQPVYGFQSKGLDGKEELVTHFPEMAANYIKEMKKVQRDGPYYLGGYCLGGAIAYEMAQQLKQNGDEIALIALLESYNIRQAPDRFPFYYKIYHYIQHIGFQIGNIILSKSENRSRYFKDKLKLELSRYKIKFNIVLSKLSVKAGIGKGLNYTHLMIDKINDKALYEYIPQMYDGKVALFKPKRYYAGLNDPSFGWGKLTSGGIKIIEMPINPRGILNKPFVKDLAQKLKEEINQCINS